MHIKMRVSFFPVVLIKKKKTFINYKKENEWNWENFEHAFIDDSCLMGAVW